MSAADHMPDGFKLDHPHIPDCVAARDEDGLTFLLHDGNEWNRDKLGRKRGHTQWHRFRCNDCDCQAILLVRWDVLARFVNQVDVER